MVRRASCADDFRLNLRVVHPRADAERDQWQHDTDGCCAARKVEPLQRALAGRRRGSPACAAPTPRPGPTPRSSTSTRSATSPRSTRWRRGATTMSPTTRRSSCSPSTRSPARGYASIGCWPCTRPVTRRRGRPRGRWAGSAKTECGLHVEPGSTTGASRGAQVVSDVEDVKRASDHLRGELASRAGERHARRSPPRAARCCSSSTASTSRTTATCGASGRRRSCRSPIRAWCAPPSPAASSPPSSGSPSTASPSSPTARCGSPPARACSSTSSTRARCTSSSTASTPRR